jgi:hypothetical protein
MVARRSAGAAEDGRPEPRPSLLDRPLVDYDLVEPMLSALFVPTADVLECRLDVVEVAIPESNHRTRP